MASLQDLKDAADEIGQRLATINDYIKDKMEPLTPEPKVYKAGQWFYSNTDGSYYSLVSSRDGLLLVQYPNCRFKAHFMGDTILQSEFKNYMSPIEVEERDMTITSTGIDLLPF